MTREIWGLIKLFIQYQNMLLDHKKNCILQKNDVKERITTTPAGDQVDKGVGNIQK